MDPSSFDAHATTPARETALSCLGAAVAAAHPERVVADSISLDGDALSIAGGDDGLGREYDLADYDEVVVVGGGKAGDGVADALYEILGDRIAAGAVVTTDPADSDGPIERLRGDHPVPSERGVAGAERVADLARQADERTLVIAVVTGGASALLPSPAEGISLSDLQATTDALLDSGAEIGDLNAVRKHLSTLKGGGLARLAAPATVVTLAFSDVVGDDLSVIGSGPTVPDETTYGDAIAVLDRFGVDAPAPVCERLERGAAREIEETPGSEDPAFERVTTHVLATGFTALSAAREEARERGYDPCILSSRVRGEAREAAKTHVAIAEEALATGNPIEPPAVVLSGGECTVTVRGDGEGGPNQEFALSAALELPAGATLACADSDGIDGGSGAAGALVDADTVDDAAAARDALTENDAGTYLGERDALLETGPTGTNVNDVRVLVVEDAGD
jgi:hydroxypyruvate reductase